MKVTGFTSNKDTIDSIKKLWECDGYFLSKNGKWYIGDLGVYRYLPYNEVPNFILSQAIAELFVKIGDKLS